MSRWVLNAAIGIMVGGVALWAGGTPTVDGAEGTDSAENTEAAQIEEGAALFKSKTCFTCHGADAKSPIMPTFPKLAGQNEEYVLQQIRDIKSGARSNGNAVAMKGIMHLVSDEEIQVLAKYISSLEP